MLLVFPLDALCSKQDLHLTSQEGIICDTNGLKCKAQKNVHVRYGLYESFSPFLNVHFHPNHKIKTIHAYDRVKLIYGMQHEAHGRRLFYDLDKGMIKLKEDVSFIDHTQHHIFHTSSLVVYQSKKGQIEKITTPKPFRLRTPTFFLHGHQGTFQLTTGAYALHQYVTLLFSEGIIVGPKGTGNINQKTHTLFRAPLDDRVYVLLVK